MTAEEFRKIEEIFQSAIQIAPDTRSNFVKLACGYDIELRQQVERLLILIAIVAFRISIGGKKIFGNNFLPDTNMK